MPEIQITRNDITIIAFRVVGGYAVLNEVVLMQAHDRYFLLVRRTDRIHPGQPSYADQVSYKIEQLSREAAIRDYRHAEPEDRIPLEEAFPKETSPIEEGLITIDKTEAEPILTAAYRQFGHTVPRSSVERSSSGCLLQLVSTALFPALFTCWYVWQL